MKFEPITGAGIPTTKLPFSAAIRAGDLVFISGQASIDDAGDVISDTFENEMRRSLENMRRILTAAGLEFGDVVQVRSYVKNYCDLAEYNRIYREYFSEPYPARTTIVNCLGKVLYEIDAIACARNK